MAKRTKKHAYSLKNRRRRRFLGLFERLEERLPLTGPYVNAPISASQSQFLADGVQGLSGMGDRVDQSSDFNAPLGPFKDRNGRAVTPGDLGPFGRTIREEIENPIDEYFDATPVDQRTTDSLVLHLGANPAFIAIEGGLVDGVIDEIVFDIHIQREYDLSLLEIEFDSDNLPISFFSKSGVEANLHALVDIHLIYGITLDPSLSLQQATFVREMSLSSSIRVDSILHPFTVNLGFLEASVPDVVLAASLDIEVNQPSSSPTLRLTEIETLEVTNLLEKTIGTNDFNATFNLDVGIGRWRLDGSTYLQTVGDFLGFDPAITFSPNFDEVFLFNNISGSEIAAGIENFQAWLTSFCNTSSYDANIPFTQSATTGSIYNAGEAMSDWTDSLRDEEGNPSFDNAADFPYSGNGVDYDPVTNKLQFTIVQALPEQQIQSRSTRVSLDDTVGLNSNTEATITGSGTISFIVAIDLSREGVDFRDRISIEDLRLRTFYGTEAVVLTGNAAFGGLGLAFANAILSGQFSASAIFASQLRGGAPLTLRTLNDSLDDIESLLSRNVEFVSNSVMRIPSISVLGNLFAVASDAFVEVTATDIQNGIYETTTNVPDFFNFENLSFEGLTDTISDAILGTQAWDKDGDDAVATLGMSLDDFGALQQDRIVNAINEAVDEVDNAVGLSRRIVQDVDDFIQDLDVSSPSGTVDFVSSVAYEATTGVFSWFVDASSEEETTVSSGLGFSSIFGYTQDPNVDDTSDLVGSESSLPVRSTSRLQLGLEIDPSSGGSARGLPNAFLTSQSRLDRTVFVNATPATGNAVSVEGASGAIAMHLRDGSVVIAQDLNAPDSARPAVFSSSIPATEGRVRVSELGSYVPSKSTLGRLRADFEVVPDHTGTPEANRLTFRVLNFNNPLASTSLLSSPNFPQMRQGIDLQINLGAMVPSIEDYFKQLEKIIIDEVLARAYPLLGDSMEQFANFVEPVRSAIESALDALSSFNVSDIENAIETALRNLFHRPNRDFVNVDISSPTQVSLTINIANAPISKTSTAQTNLGVPALGLDWQSEFSVIGSYDFQMTFVLDAIEGFYVETDSDVITVDLDVDMTGQATGTLGFFDVIATAEAPAPGQSAFHAQYLIDLTEPSGDAKLFLNEIGTGPLIDSNTSGLSGEAHMAFNIEAAVSPWMPSLETGLRIDWTFDGIGFSGNNPPTVTYQGIQLNLGPLLTEVFLPFFNSINDVFDPMRPIIDVLVNPLPVLSDFADPDPSILSIAELVASALPADSSIRKSIESLVSFVQTIDTIDRIVQALQTDGTSGLALQLGDLTFGGPSQPQFDARSNQLDRSVLNLANATSNLRSQFEQGAPGLTAELTTTPGALHFPIIEDPLNAIGWLLGVDEAELITWDLPSASVNIPIDFEFPIFPGIMAGIFGGLEIGFDFKVGLDTAGFDAFRDSGDVRDLFNGFYVSDRANANGTGADVNEVFIRGDLLAGAGVGVSIAGVGVSLTVGGGVFSEIGIDLIDHDHDGKVRGNDFSSSEGCFALNGEVGVALEARAKVGIFKFELPVAQATLARGRVEIACPFYEPPPPAILAGLDPITRTLTLYMGPEAEHRSVRPNAEEEDFVVKQENGQIVVLAFGRSQVFDESLVQNIVADGGTKDDRIELIHVSKPTILRGGDGDDVIFGGEMSDVIDGGPGRDELHGRGENDTLVGDTGSDLLWGDDGDDDLFGDEGDDVLYGGIGDDTIETGNGRNTAYGEEGNDTIIGGIFVDWVYGGNDDDSIEGRGGADVLNGEGGVDTIHGNFGDDVIDGGGNGDFLYGDEGSDRIYGRRGDDWIEGGDGDDYINGNEGSDTLEGHSGSDELVGEIGDDTIRGGNGSDLLYGDQGYDTIDGGDADDTIYGGAQDDVVDGGNGNDVIYGEQGNDELSGNVGNDRIWGGVDSDTIYGYLRDRNEDSIQSGATDQDELWGEEGFDRIAGGPQDDRIQGGSDGGILVGNEGADTIDGGDGIDVIYGFHLNEFFFWAPMSGGTDLGDVLHGGSSDDTIYGGPGADEIRGARGNDRLFGESGADAMFGDDGDDMIEGGDDVDVVDGGLGNDVIRGNDDADSLYGNMGLDWLEGNLGDDLISGNDQADIAFGDEGADEIYGGKGNDTLRGGDDDDTIHGDAGDDLIIGFTGSDFLYGGDDDDVIYAGQQPDTIFGDAGNDRIYGELGEDTISGGAGDDSIQGGAGDDTISGDAGNDSLYGDDGQDTLNGGLDNDFLFAGDGITNLLNGDEGNDTLIGSDDGDEDTKFGDTIFFGDRLNGGDGDDTIDGLGGADVIDGGAGNNTIYSGRHTDSVVNGVDLSSAVDGTSASVPFLMSTGPDRRGRWSELSGSANLGGLTNVGGFEESVYVDNFGTVYIAWVDWRNGNSEIYVAYHPAGLGGWTPLPGFGAYNSASGGGISNDASQSRRPTLFKTESNDALVVAWTSIEPDGTRTIEVAQQDTNWDRISNPAQTGNADHAKFVKFANHSGLLFWAETNPTSLETSVGVTQYVNTNPVGVPGTFLPARGIGALPAGKEFKDYDVAAVEFQSAIAISAGNSRDQDIVIRANDSTYDFAVGDYVSNNWRTLHTIVDGDTQNPTIGIQYIAQRGTVLGEIDLEFDIGVAWEVSDSRENQVDGLVLQARLDEPRLVILPMVPQYDSDVSPRSNAETISDTAGYADTPSLAMSYWGTFLAWKDDGVFAGDNRSSIHVLSRFRDVDPGEYVLRENEKGDASGVGISSTGGSLQALTLEVARDGFMATNPYAVWTESATPLTLAGPTGTPVATGTNGPNTYLRVTLNGLQAVDDSARLRKHGLFEGNVLDNDLNLFGEVEGFVSMFDGRPLDRFSNPVVEFISPLGARVTANMNGELTYNPRGVAAFQSLRRNESLTESFVYRVNNWIFEAEAVVEFVVFGGNAWRNERNHLDVDDDSFVGPLDVLNLINDINQNGTRDLDDVGPSIRQFFDVDDDGSISPLDVLIVINWINSHAFGGGEGEGVGAAELGASENVVAQYFASFDTDNVSYDEFSLRKSLKRNARKL